MAVSKKSNKTNNSESFENEYVVPDWSIKAGGVKYKVIKEIVIERLNKAMLVGFTLIECVNGEYGVYDLEGSRQFYFLGDRILSAIKDSIEIINN